MTEKCAILTMKRDSSSSEIFRQLLFLKFLKQPNKDLAEEIVQLSISLAEKKFGELTEQSILTDYSANAESHLWKNIFYNTIEALRRAANLDDLSSENHKEILLKFIDKSAHFYSELLDKYECFIAPLSLNDYLYWSHDSLLFCTSQCFIVKNSHFFFENGKEKTILRSAQRHFLSLGDLFRYKATLSASRSANKLAKMWYFKAAQSNMLNGKAFNQLGVLAVQSRNYLDALFYYITALSAKHPFIAARESLELVCNQIRQISALELKTNNEGFKDKCIKFNNGRKSKQSLYSRSKSVSQSDEVWFLPEKIQSFFASNMECTELKNSKAQKKALSNLINVAGILISNIGMEDYEKNQKQAICDLSLLIRLHTSVINSTALLKIVLIFIFANVHVKNGLSKVLAKLQREYSLRMIIDILWVILQVLDDNIKYLADSSATIDFNNINFMIDRVLPAFCVLNEWIFSPPKTTSNMLAEKTASYFCGNNSNVNVFTLHVSVLNKIQILQKNNKIIEFSCNKKVNKNDHVCVMLPELIISSFFHGIFHYPASYFFATKGDMITTTTNENMTALTFNCRLNSILLKALAQDKSLTDVGKVVKHLHYLHRVKNFIDGSLEFQFVDNLLNKKHIVEGLNEISNISESSLNIAHMQNFPIEDDEILKERLIFEENIAQNKKVQVEVRPKFLIPDTNTFIDHLEGIKKIVNSKLFVVLVPTTVMSELNSLSKDVAGRKAFGLLSQKLIARLSPGLVPKSKERNVQMQFVMQQATTTLDFLRQAAENRTSNLTTITSNGNILPRISFAQEVFEKEITQTNDDRILASAIALASKVEGSLNFLHQKTRNSTFTLERKVVFLTEDRTLIIKAAAAKIPVRDVPSLIEWSKV